MDFAGGSPIPSGGLVYHGGANVTETGDVMRLENGRIGRAAYRFFTATDGAVAGRTITYTGLEPVVDTTSAASLTVNGTNARNSITYRKGSSAARGLVSVDGFETIEFENKTALTIDGLDGDDDVVLNNPNVPTGLSNVTVNGGNGNDAVSVYAVGQTATLSGDHGDDLFRVVPSPAAAVGVDGGGQVLGDVLLMDATAAKARDTGTAIQVESFAPVGYADVERVERVTRGKRKMLLRQRAF